MACIKLLTDSDVSLLAKWVSFRGNCGKLQGVKIVTQLWKTCPMYANVVHLRTFSTYAPQRVFDVVCVQTISHRTLFLQQFILHSSVGVVV